MFYPKMVHFGLIHLDMIAYIFEILYQYVNKYGYYKYFPISRDFKHRNFTILPQNSKIWIYSAWHNSLYH